MGVFLRDEKKLRPQDRIIVAVDVPSLEKLQALIAALTGWVGLFKIGMELQTAVGGPQAMECVQTSGGRTMYDGKFGDIPATMKGATAALLRTLGAHMFTVHASAGFDAMKAAADVKGGMFMLAVTVLTSLDQDACAKIFGTSPQEKVLQLAFMALEAGADGLVCSPQELKVIRGLPSFDGLKLVVPGIRPEWAATGDQARVMTPKEAMTAGADYLVIGRPITNPPTSIGDPVEAARMIAVEIEEGLADRGAA